MTSTWSPFHTRTQGDSPSASRAPDGSGGELIRCRSEMTVSTIRRDWWSDWLTLHRAGSPTFVLARCSRTRRHPPSSDSMNRSAASVNVHVAAPSITQRHPPSQR